MPKSNSNSEDRNSVDRCDQKLKTLCVLQILMDYTDEDHAISRVELTDYLEKEYGIVAERKGIYRDMDAVLNYLDSPRMRSMGFQLETRRDGNITMYYLKKRMFTTGELKVLVDAVRSSKFTEEKQADLLTKKIRSLGSTYEAKQLKSNIKPLGRVTQNPSVMRTLDVINLAMDEGTKMQCRYNAYNREKKLVPVHDGKLYLLSPWDLYYDNGRYYLIAYDEGDEKIKHFRVDKISSARKMGEERIGDEKFAEINTPDYASRMINMFGGEDVKVHLLCENRMANVIVDQYGSDVRIYSQGADHFEAIVDVYTSEQFYGWIIGLGGAVTITAPQKCVDDMKKITARLMKAYGVE